MVIKKKRLYCLLAASFIAVQFAACKTNQPAETNANESAGIDTNEPVENNVPIILAEAPEFDFGQVKQGQEVEHIFKIKNVGSKELVIEKTHGS